MLGVAVFAVLEKKVYRVSSIKRYVYQNDVHPLKTNMEPRSRKSLGCWFSFLKRGDFSFHPILPQCNSVTLRDRNFRFPTRGLPAAAGMLWCDVMMWNLKCQGFHDANVIWVICNHETNTIFSPSLYSTCYGTCSPFWRLLWALWSFVKMRNPARIRDE